MDLLRSDDNENWTALLAAVVSAFLITALIAFVLDDGGMKGDGPRERPRAGLQADEPRIPQARWKMAAFAAPNPGVPTNRQRKAVKRVTPQVKETVQDLYDALTVSRRQFSKVARRLLPADARKSLRGRPLVPFKLTRIQTLKREARIAIDLKTRAAASAKVTLRFRARSGKKRVMVAHNGTLWLERSKKGWQIIAFDLDQRKRS